MYWKYMESKKRFNMKVYYIGYQYGDEIEYIDGPFTYWYQAFDQSEKLRGEHDALDEKLRIVSETKEVWGT